MRSVRPVMMVCLALVGCGGPKFPPETDASKGRDVLQTVLDVWKKGGMPDDLRQATPAVIVRDPDWKAGCRLNKYELAAENRRAGVDLLVSVRLELTRPDGRTQEKKVNFTVGIGDSTVVLRSE